MTETCLCSRASRLATDFLSAHPGVGDRFTGVLPARFGPNVFLFQFDRSELVGLVIVPSDQAGEFGKRVGAAASSYDYASLITGGV